MIKMNQPSKGFSLVEVLVVIALVTVIGLILTEVFFRSIRGGNKAQALATIKQNGQATLESLDKNIRSSDNIICPRVIPPSMKAESDVLVIVNNGAYTRYRLVTMRIVEDHPMLQADVTQEEFLLDICTNVDLSYALPIAITDLGKVAVVSSNVCELDKSAGFKDIVRINFLLEPGQEVPKIVADQIDPVPFVTTIQLR